PVTGELLDLGSHPTRPALDDHGPRQIEGDGCGASCRGRDGERGRQGDGGKNVEHRGSGAVRAAELAQRSCASDGRTSELCATQRQEQARGSFAAQFHRDGSEDSWCASLALQLSDESLSERPETQRGGSVGSGTRPGSFGERTGE